MLLQEIIGWLMYKVLLLLNEPGDPLFVVQNLSRKKINSRKVKLDKNDLQSMPFRRISVCQVCSVLRLGHCYHE